MRPKTGAMVGVESMLNARGISVEEVKECVCNTSMGKMIENE